MHSIGFLLRATETKWKSALKIPRYYVSPHIQGNVCSNTLQQLEKFKYLGVVFTSDGRRHMEIDTLIDEANAVLRELYRPVVTKQELSNTAKLPGFKSVFIPILTCGHESWLVTESVLPQVQVTEMGFVRRVHNVQFRDTVRSCLSGHFPNWGILATSVRPCGVTK